VLDLRSLRDAQSSSALLRSRMGVDARKLKEDALGEGTDSSNSLSGDGAAF